MNTKERVGRNEPCPCGSGKKFKTCCEGRADIVEDARRSPWMMGGLAVVGLAAVATAVMQFAGSEPTAASSGITGFAPAQPPLVQNAGSSKPIDLKPLSGGPTPQPPGPAPEGKVWSAEHGHYHDAPGAAPQVPVGATPSAAPVVAQGTSTPEPPGPAPAGKVWSAEHGHYHDAPGAVPQGATGAQVTTATEGAPSSSPQPVAQKAPTPEPPGPAPAGKVWSAEHGHYHDAPSAIPQAAPGATPPAAPSTTPPGPK